MPSPSEHTPGRSVEAELAAAQAMSDDDLEAMVAAQRVARAAAAQAEARAVSEAAPDIEEARRKIEDSFDWDNVDQQRRGYK